MKDQYKELKEDVLDEYTSDYHRQPRPEAPVLLEEETDPVPSEGRRKCRSNRMRCLVPPSASSPAVSAVMRGNSVNDTSPELLLRSALWKSGIRGYRKHLQDLPGRPDIAFPRHWLAVFVHGCFWHRCPKCNIPVPRTNTSYWKEKLRRNIERDKRVFSELEHAGWRTMRLWECEIHHSLEWCISRVRQGIRRSSMNRCVSPMSGTNH